MDSIYFTTVKIDVYHKSKYLWTGTGFFYNSGKKKYIVTNKHILDKEKKRWFQGGGFNIPSKVVVKIHGSHTDLLKHTIWEIQLRDDNRNFWHSHSKIDCDVALIPLDDKTLIGEHLKTFIPYFSPRLTFISEPLINTFDINSFAMLAVLGYPLAFHDATHNLPIGRTASLATPYNVDFNGKPCFLVDGRLFEGMSGSPVVCTPHNLFVQGGKPEGQKLLGIFSEQIISNKQPLQLHVVWHARLIKEIADKVEEQEKYQDSV